MRIHKWNGLMPLNVGLSSVIDDLFNSSLSDIVKTDFTNTNPAVNIIEEDDQYKIELAVPGLTKADFDLSVEEGKLIIKSESKEEKVEESDDQTFTKKEFNYSSFKRSFNLSDDIDTSSIDALYKNGILTISLLKKEEAKIKEPTVIEIK